MVEVLIAGISARADLALSLAFACIAAFSGIWLKTGRAVLFWGDGHLTGPPQVADAANSADIAKIGFFFLSAGDGGRWRFFDR